VRCLDGGGCALSASIEDADAGTPDERPQFGEPGSINSPGWDHSRVVALLEEDTDVPALLAEASAAIGLSEPLNYAVGTVADQNWVQLTQSQFDPIRVSERLWIVPSWHESPDPAAINLILDPGMAFGTGSHPTTRLCLEWLERTVSPSCSVLDYGCGSGILAIAAARLGAGRVAGVDIDPQAVESARANAERNEVSALFADSAEPVAGEYDLVVANILSNPLRVLAPAICAHVRSGGCLALSGILREQAEEIIAIYAHWLPMEVADTREDWVCLSGVKP
jgi:ribosomal protein L11 methyltransferase